MEILMFQDSLTYRLIYHDLDQSIATPRSEEEPAMTKRGRARPLLAEEIGTVDLGQFGAHPRGRAQNRLQLLRDYTPADSVA